MTHNVTIDFNGKSITAEGSWVDQNNKRRAIDVTSCKLTFKDSSATAGTFTCSYGGVKLWGESPAFELNDVTINCTTSYAVQTGWNANGASAVMTSGTINGGAFDLSNYNCNRAAVTINGGTINIESPNVFTGIYVGDSDVTIHDGTFICAGEKELLNVGTGGKGRLVIDGGEFTTTAASPNVTDIFWYYGQGTVQGGTFNVDPGDRVASGYEAVKNNSAGTWTVQEKTTA